MIAAEHGHLEVAAGYYRPIVETRLAGLESDAALVTALVALGRERRSSSTTHWALGMCAGTLGNVEEAEGWFTSALTLCREMELPPFEARVELAWAEVCDRWDLPGRQAHAARAHEIAADLGMVGVRERASALLA